jgi:site-specific recombinase XerD
VSALSKEQQPVIIYSVSDGLSSIHTKTSYTKNFQHFLSCQGTDEKGLVVLAKQNPRLVESMIINHIKHLADKQKLSFGSIRTHCFSIFHFLEMNDISLNIRKIMRFLPPNEGPREDRAYNHQEIQDILVKSDERSRVVVLLMASAGMRIGAMQVLRIGDLSRIEEYDLYKITVYANSPKDRYYTFCTPECAAAIDSYLAYRKRFGEELKPSAPLIREQFDIDDPFHIKYPKNLSENAFFYIIKHLLKRAGKSDNVKQSHGFRKAAITQMIKAKVDYDSREYLVGHKGSRGLGVNYDRTTEEDRLAEYLKAVDLLTINSENRLKRKIHQLESEHSEEWNALKSEMNELKQLLSYVGARDDRDLQHQKQKQLLNRLQLETCNEVQREDYEAEEASNNR